MKLEQLGSNFGLMNEEEQRIFFIHYIEERALDLAKVSTIIKVKSKKKGKNITISSENLEILKSIGLV